jgi:hypothetical protein
VFEVFAFPWRRAAAGVLLHNRHGVLLRKAEAVDQGEGHLERCVMSVLASDRGWHFGGVRTGAGDEVSHEKRILRADRLFLTGHTGHTGHRLINTGFARDRFVTSACFTGHKTRPCLQSPSSL